jgi:hypothetical protein
MNKEEIPKELAAGELEVEAASKLLLELDQLKRSSLYCKVSEKGAVGVYGLQRMPVTRVHPPHGAGFFRLSTARGSR